MMRLRFLVPLLGFSSLLVVACSGDDPSDTDGEGGGAGEGPAPVGGDAGGGGEGGGGCTLESTGTLVIEVSGLPDDVDPEVIIEGPDELLVSQANDSFEGVTSGAYTATASRVFDADPTVRTVFDATVTLPDFTLCDGSSHTIKVSYEAIPSSNKLWMPTGLDEEGAGFASELLGASGTTDASVSIDGGIGKSIAFDRDGNLWTLGPTLDFPHVLRFPAAQLGTSGAREPDVSFNVPEVECLPAMRSLAFDAEGNLWLSVCGDSVLRIPAADLTGVEGEKEADVLLAGLTENDGLAFDKAGNLWVGGGPSIARYDAARLGDITAEPADLLLTVADDIAGLKASNLTFDKAGNLWGTDFGANRVFQIADSDLAGTGERNVVANVSIEIGVTALLNQPAFDDGNGLWLGLNAGFIGRFSPEQLGSSTASGAARTPELIIETSSVDSLIPVAFFPAPEGLPLYHSIPVE
jgi:sugar lactone lactonase YvrE